ncbi:MAG TPA: glycosyl transferase, partial [bacterium]|nr:glycosyl transferase [bacterium]
MPVIILFTGGLYALLIALLYRHLRCLFAEERRPLQDEPMVSVIIAIRNEAPHLIDCLESLAALDYPREKL